MPCYKHHEPEHEHHYCMDCKYGLEVVSEKCQRCFVDMCFSENKDLIQICYFENLSGR